MTISRSKWFILVPALLMAGCASKQKTPSTLVEIESHPAAAVPEQPPAPDSIQPPAQQLQAERPQPQPAVRYSTQQPAPPIEPSRPQQRRVVASTVPAGTRIRVRLEQTLDTKRNRAGDQFLATLDSPIVIGGEVKVPRGATFSGRVDEARHSGRLKGRANMNLSLVAFEVQGRRYRIATTHFDRVSGRHRKRNLVAIGGGSGAGSIFGALAGGPAGALIGAGAGAGAGTIGAVITGRKDVRIPVETVLSFELREPVRL
jgi:hypothetical protein